MKLTEKQEWMLNYLKNNSDYANGLAVEYITPTQVGEAYGVFKNKKGYHSSVASPVLKRLCDLGLSKRNKKGHYKFLKNGN